MRSEGRRVSTECRQTLPPTDDEPTSDMTVSAPKDESPDLQQVRDGGTDDPEAPPWNFLFVLPVAMFVLPAILGLVMCSDH